MTILILQHGRADTKPQQHNSAGKLKRRRRGGGICSHLGVLNPTEEGRRPLFSLLLSWTVQGHWKMKQAFVGGLMCSSNFQWYVLKVLLSTINFKAKVLPSWPEKQAKVDRDNFTLMQTQKSISEPESSGRQNFFARTWERFGRKRSFCQPTPNPQLSQVSQGQSNKHCVTSTALWHASAPDAFLCFVSGGETCSTNTFTSLVPPPPQKNMWH